MLKTDLAFLEKQLVCKLGDGNLFRISCDVANINLLVPLPKRSSGLTFEQEADSAVLLNIPQMHEKMADNNNRYAWSDVETKVFLDLIQRT